MIFQGFEAPSVGAPHDRTLAVFIHGAHKTRASLADPIRAARGTLGDAIAIYAPDLPYANRLDSTGAGPIVASLVADLDELWRTHGPYDRVVFIGHSMGGALLRRVFLAGSPRPPDYDGAFAFRDDLPGGVSRKAADHPWAARVERLVLIATWDKGWSLSERVGWKFWFGLNLLGFLGHISPTKLNLAGTLFDMRRGAPFIVQTRLLWMAYKRWHNPERGFEALDRHRDSTPQGVDPVVVQLTATRDDFVSPEDQIDNDVNGAVAGDDVRARYFLLEMADTDHEQSILFDATPQGRAREKIFRIALEGRANDAPASAAPALRDFARDPSLFQDRPTTPKPDVKDVVFVMHGIRDDGYWTHRIARAIKEAVAPAQAPQAGEIIHSLTPSYGYFAMLPFVLPWIRRQKVEWFMDLYVNAKACFPNATFHYVGHSNGTYLAARALRDYAAARFGRVYFAGSVVRTDFPWPSMAKHGRVERFHNARGATDWVVALLPKSIDYCSDLGGGGFDGFGPPTTNVANPALTQSMGYAFGGHGGAIQEAHWPGIAKFINSGEAPPEPPALFTASQHALLAAASRLRFGLPLVVFAVLFVFLAAIAFLFACPACTLDASPVFANGGWPKSLAFLAIFMALLASEKWSSSGWKAMLRLSFLAVGVAGTLVWLLMTLGRDLGDCQPLWAALGFTGMLALLRFGLTKF